MMPVPASLGEPAGPLPAPPPPSSMVAELEERVRARSRLRQLDTGRRGNRLCSESGPEKVASTQFPNRKC